ncbi:MAG: hypothetical protein IKM48_07870 [Clostridia bacterium]|nr:hypothetical protein [Clostridia bacterium]
MKKILLVIGIICFAACLLALLFAALNWFGYYNLMDGSHELYAKLQWRMIAGLITAAVLAASGIVCFVLRIRL